MTTPPTIKIEDPFADRPQPASNFALFNYGFRPFFFLAGLFAVISVPMWVGLFAGHLDMALVANPVLWHGHEMLFGFATAAIAGFFLTVVPNWTKVKATRGPVLMALAALWLIGRVAFWTQAIIPYGLVIAADMLFLIALTATVIRPLIDPQHRRQFLFVPILLVLIAANAMTHLGILDVDIFDLDWGARGLVLGIDVVIVLIVVMGGRVTPSFTSSYLGHGDPAIKVRQNPQLDRAVLWATWAVLVADQLVFETPIAGGVALIAGVLHAVRLAGWQGHRTLGNPILWVLHLAYGWLVVGLVLKGLGGFDLFRPNDVLHALTIGAMGTYILGIMSRASLGHTGRVIDAAPLTVVAYVLVSASALARLAVIVFPSLTLEWVMISGLAWCVAFLAFMVVYAPILMRPRIDGRPG